MCCWNSLQHAYNYNSWFSISPWENNHCSMKDEWCPSPLSPKTHVQTDSALSGLCPVSKYRCRRSEMFTHVHLEETYMLLFDGSTRPSFFVVDDHWQALHVSCRGHWVTLTLTLNKGGRSSQWANGPDFWKICHTVENVEHRNGNLFEERASSELKCCGAYM